MHYVTRDLHESTRRQVKLELLIFLGCIPVSRSLTPR